MSRGNAGDDTIVGGAGDDTLIGNGGEDTIYGNAGDDFAEGGFDDDRVFLGGGNDEYGTAEDQRFLQKGDDLVRGGAGNDTIIDSFGSNTLHGDEGADELVAYDFDDEGTPDTVFGGYGDDTIKIDMGDIATGGEGEDDFYVADTIGLTEDTVTITDFTASEDRLVIDLYGDRDAYSETDEVELTETEEGGSRVASG